MIKNDGSTENRLIYLAGEINSTTTSETCKQILELLERDNISENKEKNFTRKPIKLFIQSRGGNVRDMWSLIDIILTSKTPIHTYCTGYAHSAGLYIFIAGHKRFLTQHAEVMYHQISSGSWGSLKDMEEDMYYCQECQRELEEYMILQTKIKERDLLEVKNSKYDWYIKAEEAVELGIANEIVRSI